MGIYVLNFDKILICLKAPKTYNAAQISEFVVSTYSKIFLLIMKIAQLQTDIKSSSTDFSVPCGKCFNIT